MRRPRPKTQELPPTQFYKFKANQLPLADSCIHINHTGLNVEIFVATETEGAFDSTPQELQNELTPEQLAPIFEHLKITVIEKKPITNSDTSRWIIANADPTQEYGVSQFTFANNITSNEALAAVLEYFEIDYAVEPMDFERSIKFYEHIRDRMRTGELSARETLQSQLADSFALCVRKIQHFPELRRLLEELSEIRESTSTILLIDRVSQENYHRLLASATRAINAMDLEPTQIKELLSITESDVLKDYLKELELRVTPLNGEGLCFAQIQEKEGYIGSVSTARISFSHPTDPADLGRTSKFEFQIYDVFENIEFVDRLTYLREIVYQMNLCLPDHLRLELTEGNMNHALPLHFLEVRRVTPLGEPQPKGEREIVGSEALPEYPEYPTNFAKYSTMVLRELFPNMQVRIDKVDGCFFAAEGKATNLTNIFRHPQKEELLTRILAQGYLQGKKLPNGFNAYRNQVNALVQKVVETFIR